MYTDPDREGRSPEERPVWSGDASAFGAAPDSAPEPAQPRDAAGDAAASDPAPSGSPATPPSGTYHPYMSPPPAPAPTPWWAAPSDAGSAYEQAGDETSTYTTVPPAPPQMEPVRRRSGRLGPYASLFAVALLAAALGSAGTWGAITLTGSHAAATVAPSQAAAATQSSGVADAVAGQSNAPAATNAPAQNAATPPATDIVKAAALVRPAVVTIDVAASGNGNGNGSGNGNGNGNQGGDGNGLLPGGGNGGNGGATGGTGSGIIFDPNGWILTNRHVVEAGGAITVTLADGRQFKGTTYGVDTLTDLAIVKIDATGLPAAQLGSSASIQIGESVIAIGDPLGQYPGTVTAGIVSGLNRPVQTNTENLDDLIQTDAAINPGNSGGALVDSTGHVIGVNVAGSTAAQGIGFAVPIDLAKPLVQQALGGEKLARPWLGIRYVQITPDIASQNNLPVTNGAWITSDQSSGSAVIAGSPADKAGIKANDIITAVNGAPVDSTHPFIERMSSYGPGASVTLTVRRGSQTISLTITLATRPASVQ